MKNQLVRFSGLFVILTLLISACGGAAPTTQEPVATAASPTTSPVTPTAEIPRTQITIDGDGSDWAVYADIDGLIVTDDHGDQFAGSPDIADVTAFTNDQYFYLLIRLAQQGETLQYGIKILGEGQSNNLGLWPDQNSVTRSGNQSLVGASIAQGEVIEAKIPLSELGGQGVLHIEFTQTWLGDRAGDIVDGFPVVALVELEPEVVFTQTEITIDGDPSDWAKYPVSISDPVGDQADGGADLVEAKYFANDKYLYVLITLSEPADWAGIPLALMYTDGRGGQLNIRPNHHVSVGIYDDSQDIQIDLAIVDTFVEFRVLLESLPAPLANINGIRIFGDDVLDDSDNAAEMRGLSFLNELEPANGPNLSGQITGLISTDTTWSGEIHVTGDIFLGPDVTLTIEPGTTVFLASNSDDQHNGLAHGPDDYTDSNNDPVRLAEWDQNAITIDGRGGILHIVGTAEEPIVFKPEGESTSSAQWDGIYIERGTIQYSKVLYAGRTAIQPLGFVGEQIEIAYNEVRFFHWAGIDSHTNNVWIHHNFVEGGGHQAITAASENVVEYNFMTNCQNAMFIGGIDVIVRNNIAVDCARGLQISGNIPAGSQITIINNTVAQLQGPPDGWYYQGMLIYPAFDTGGGLEVFTPNLKVTIQNNIVLGPFTWGIGVHKTLGLGSVVDYNLIWGTDDHYTGRGIGAVGSHNIFADPLIVLDLAAQRYEFASGSPAIDAGAPGTMDADGSPADLGAFGGEFAYGW